MIMTIHKYDYVVFVYLQSVIYSLKHFKVRNTHVTDRAERVNQIPTNFGINLIVRYRIKLTKNGCYFLFL